MTNKLNKVTSIRKKFVQPGFIFSASYILFSADSCFGLARGALKQQQAVAHNHNNGISENTSSSRANIKVNGYPKNLAEGASTKPSFSQPAGEAAQKDPTPVVPSQATPANRGGTGDSLKNNTTEGTNGDHVSHVNDVNEQPVPVVRVLEKHIANPALTTKSPSLVLPLVNVLEKDTEITIKETPAGSTNLDDCPTNKVLSEDTRDGQLNCLDKEETGPLKDSTQEEVLNQPFQEKNHTDLVVLTQSSSGNSTQGDHNSDSGRDSQGASTGAIPPPPPMPKRPLTLPMASFNVKKNTASTGDGQSAASPTGKVNNENAFAEELKRKLPPRIGDDEVESKDTGDGQSHSLNRENSMPMTGNTENLSSGLEI